MCSYVKLLEVFVLRTATFFHLNASANFLFPFEFFYNTGQPFPKVTWWRENRLLDATSENVIEDRVRNTLRIPNLKRSDLSMTLTCQASNNNISIPTSALAVVDMKRKKYFSCFCTQEELSYQRVKNKKLMQFLETHQTNVTFLLAIG